MTRLVGGMSKKLIRQKFDDFDGNKNGFLEFDEFKRFFKTLMPGCLTDAAKNGDVRMVKQVLEAGVAPDERDSHQSTPLIHAVWPGYREVIELLLIHRADVNAQNIKGNTAVHFAFEKDHEDIVRCGAGGSLTGRLHPISPHPCCYRHLLNHGGTKSLSLKNSLGKTPGQLNPKLNQRIKHVDRPTTNVTWLQPTPMTQGSPNPNPNPEPIPN